MTSPDILLTPEQEAAARKLGAVAYAAYCQASNGRSLISGYPLPGFEDLQAPIQRAWMMAGVVVAMFQTEELRKGLVQI